MKIFTKLFLSTFIFIVFAAYTHSQDLPSSEKYSNLSSTDILGINHTSVNGTIFKTINLIKDRTPLGVTYVNSKIIVSSSDNNGGKFFDVYDSLGNYLSSTAQSTTSTYGYRDLAFDGTYILASDDSTIKKIDPNTFQVISQITNTDDSPHRGLAYDPNEGVIYSSNWRHSILKIDPVTGATIKTLGKPSQNVYGLAIDFYSNPNYASLWFSEPTNYTKFRLSRADTTSTSINFTYDLTTATPDSALNGGLEIINNYPGYADSVIALIIDQHNHALYLVNITGTPQNFPASLETVGQFGGANETGITTSGMIQYDKYLYSVDNGKLAIYDIKSNPAAPAFIKSLDVPNGSRIFLARNFEDKIIVTTYNKSTHVSGFAAFSLSDPLNPQWISQTTTEKPIIAMDVGSYSYVLEERISKLFVYYMGTYANPVINKTYDLQGFGMCLARDPSNHLLFVGTSGSSIQNGIQVFDYTNPNNLVKKSSILFIGNYPQRIVVIPSVHKIIVGANSTSGNSSKLMCYDYSDPTNLTFKKLEFTSNQKEIWDMRLIDNMIIVTVPEDGKFLTYKWDDESNVFLMGPSSTLTAPLEIINYLPPNPPQNIKENYSVLGGTPQDRYFYIPNGEASGATVVGDKKTEIVKTQQPPPPPAGKVNLTMNLNPSNATAHGCSVIPSAGVHQYNKGAGVNLYATANEAEGWYFNKWTGDASGTNLITHITMDKDKNVTANFVELLLTISGKKEAAVYCPNEIDKNPQVFSLPIIVTASDADDWEMEKISLKTKGSGDELEDISKVEIFLGSSVKYSGNFSVDDGQISATFNPPISIGAGESVTLNLIYTFIFNSPIYAHDTTKSFYLETFAAVAKPVHYDAGKITGKAVHDSLTFARIKNFYDIPFTTIKEAVKSKYTEDGDTCYVCAGTYEGNWDISTVDKSVTIKSIEGKEKTIIKPTSVLFNGVTLSAIEDSYINFIGFTVDGSSIPMKPGYNGIYSGGTKGGKISDNTIKGFFVGITYFGKNAEITNNLIEDCRTGGNFECKDSKISNNIFQNNSYKYDMDIYYCENTEISGNKSFNPKFNNSFRINGGHVKYLNINNNTILDLTLEDVDSCTIKYNTAAQRISIKSATGSFIKYNTVENNTSTINDAITVTKKEKGGYNYIINNTIRNNQGLGIGCDGNISVKYNYIYGNGSMGLSGLMLSEGPGIVASNHIYQNKSYGIVLYYAKNILITNNYISGHAQGFDEGAGIYILGSDKNKIWDNVIKKNDTGIKLANSSNNSIHNNTISDNTSTSTGIHINDSSPDIFDNNITNNNGNGIFCENNAKPIISNNNIIGNSLFGLNNDDAGLNINANGNFWGSSSGPGQQDISGNVTANQWLSKQVSLVANSQIDSAFALINSSDSVALYIQNLKTYNDIVKITVSDDKGWMTPLTDYSLTLSDSTGAEFYLKYIIPNNAQTQDVSTVSYSVYSTSDSSTASGTFYLKTYAQVLNSLYIFTDSLTVKYGDSVRFLGVGFDQHENSVQINPNWSATHGTISSTGVFFSDSTTGEGMITLTDQTSGMKAYAHFYNSDQTEALNKITIEPDSVVLKSLNGYLFTAEGYNQFNYPKDFVQVWNSSGGTINNIGFFTPDSVNTKYIITVSDTSNTIIDSAVVIMESVTGIRGEDIIPKNYTLFQNYPNPFNPSTTIRFSLVEPSFVKLEVFNILGQRVMVAVDSYLNAGTYNKVLNFKNYASGVYIYRLIAKGKFTDVKKLILLK